MCDELVNSTTLNVIALKYYPGKQGHELTEQEVKEGLLMLGDLETMEIDEETFEREVRRVVQEWTEGNQYENGF